MLRYAIPGLLLIAVMICFSCGEGEVNILGFTDPEIPIDVRYGETFWISLRSNATTGYHWSFLEPVDDSLLTFLDERYIPDPNPQGKCGVGGHQQWDFQAANVGSTFIKLGYILNSEPPDTAETATFAVNIRYGDI